MKALCTTSHQVPLNDGKFIVYEAGIEYEVKDGADVGPYFRPEQIKTRRHKAVINEET